MTSDPHQIIISLAVHLVDFKKTTLELREASRYTRVSLRINARQRRDNSLRSFTEYGTFQRGWAVICDSREALTS